MGPRARVLLLDYPPYVADEREVVQVEVPSGETERQRVRLGCRAPVEEPQRDTRSVVDDRPVTSAGVDVDRVRAWAAGQPGLEAAVDLLARVDLLDRYARQGAELLGASWFVDFDAAAVDVWPGGVLAPADVAVVAVAVSLAGVGPVVDEALDEQDVVRVWRAFSLAEVLPALDRDRAVVVLAAIAHASGVHHRGPTPA